MGPTRRCSMRPALCSARALMALVGTAAGLHSRRRPTDVPDGPPRTFTWGPPREPDQSGEFIPNPGFPATQQPVTDMRPSFLSRSRPNKWVSPPNILYILADDLGWADLGYRNSDMITPNIDGLAGEGVRLENFYVEKVCSATRASLLTGRYPHRFGFQHFNPPKALGGVGAVPTSEKMLPAYLKEVGYATHIVGKWHGGLSKEKYLPHHRGFDTHYGYYEGGIKFFNHTIGGYRDMHYGVAGMRSSCAPQQEDVYDHDLWTRAAQNIIDTHDLRSPLFIYLAYHAVHNPNECPLNFYDMYPNVTDSGLRRTYCGMVTAMDAGLGTIVNHWRTARGEDFWRNSVVIFHSDNGAPTGGKGGGMNIPLRGGKNTLYDGGMRVNSFVLSPLLENPGRIETGLLHVTDMLPTIVYRLAGVPPSPNHFLKPLDGTDVWDTISRGDPSPRTEIVHAIDPLGNGNITLGPQIVGCDLSGSQGTPGPCQPSAALRHGRWKLIVGMFAACSNSLSTFSEQCGYYQYNTSKVPAALERQQFQEPREVTTISDQGDGSSIPVALFDMESDPFEFDDLSAQHMDTVYLMLRRLMEIRKGEWMDPQWPPYSTCDTPTKECWMQFENYNMAYWQKGCVSPFLNSSEWPLRPLPSWPAADPPSDDETDPSNDLEAPADDLGEVSKQSAERAYSFPPGWGSDRHEDWE